MRAAANIFATLGTLLTLVVGSDLGPVCLMAACLMYSLDD